MVQPSLWHRFWSLTAPYWKSDQKWSAIILLAAIMGMNLGMVYIQVLINLWIKDFYNALQQDNKAAFFADLWRFGKLATAYIVQYVYMIYLNQMLQIRWRTWLTENYLAGWLGHQAYYRLQFLDDATDNPDQRISEDISSYLDLTMSLSIDMLSSVATLVSFTAILWGLSGTLSIPMGSWGAINIPGYMVWAAVVYAVVGTWLTIWVGNPLIMLNFNQQRFEADFRFSMARLRENSECVALYRGEKAEQTNFLSRFKEVVNNYWRIMIRQKRLNWLTSGYNQLAVIYPILMAAPRFFAGKMHLGGLMQTVAAFSSVQTSLSYLVNSYTTIARWNAVLDRLTGFSGALDHVETLVDRQELQRLESPDGSFAVKSLNVFLPDHKVLLQDLSLQLDPGTSLLIMGPSGCGKSTLIRALAGIWPYASGTVLLPAEARVMFLPQRPYLPMGTLRDALLYPYTSRVAQEQLPTILDLCFLTHLKPALDQTHDWSQSLSLGEQQRIAFARILLQRPDYMFLDEATASVDEEMEAKLYQLVRARLNRATVISVGHRSTLRAWHESRLNLTGEGTWFSSSAVAAFPETGPREAE